MLAFASIFMTFRLLFMFSLQDGLIIKRSRDEMATTSYAATNMIDSRNSKSAVDLHSDRAKGGLKHLHVIKGFIFLRFENTETNDEKLSEIFQFIERYKNEKLFETLSIVSFFIEKFYYDLCLTNTKNLNTHLLNYTKILNQLNDIKRFNLDEKNIFIWIKDILINEKK